MKLTKKKGSFVLKTIPCNVTSFPGGARGFVYFLYAMLLALLASLDKLANPAKKNFEKPKL